MTSGMGQSRHDALNPRCPLYPQKRTFGSTAGMSALCQKRTHALQQIAVTALYLRTFDRLRRLV
jgi:hypothetical protein